MFALFSAEKYLFLLAMPRCNFSRTAVPTHNASLRSLGFRPQLALRCGAVRCGAYGQLRSAHCGRTAAITGGRPPRTVCHSIRSLSAAAALTRELTAVKRTGNACALRVDAAVGAAARHLRPFAQQLLLPVLGADRHGVSIARTHTRHSVPQEARWCAQRAECSVRPARQDTAGRIDPSATDLQCVPTVYCCTAGSAVLCCVWARLAVGLSRD